MTTSSSATPLPTNPFGSAGFSVCTLSIGYAPLGDMTDTFAYSVPEDRALETVRAALSGPITFGDTAASYGDGESERRIGIVIREMGGLPSDQVLATKADRDAKTGDFSGKQIRRSVERSARLLGLDRLQIVYLHDPEHAPFEELTAPGGAVEVLQQLKSEGVIEHIGVAGGPIDLMIRYVETGAFEAVITHNRYTLLNRSAEPLLQLARERGLAVMNAAPYGSGILAKGPDAYPRYAYQDAAQDIVNTARQMQDVCNRYNVPLAAAALQFSLRDPRITSTIIGMTRPERIQQTIELAQHPIPDDIWPELDALKPADSDRDPEESRWK